MSFQLISELKLIIFFAIFVTLHVKFLTALCTCKSSTTKDLRQQTLHIDIPYIVQASCLCISAGSKSKYVFVLHAGKYLYIYKLCCISVWISDNTRDMQVWWYRTCFIYHFLLNKLFGIEKTHLQSHKTCFYVCLFLFENECIYMKLYQTCGAKHTNTVLFNVRNNICISFQIFGIILCQSLLHRFTFISTSLLNINLALCNPTYFQLGWRNKHVMQIQCFRWFSL